MTRPTGRPHGRPRQPIDLDLVEQMLADGATHPQIARLLHVHRTTLERRLAERHRRPTGPPPPPRWWRCQLCDALVDSHTPATARACPNGHYRPA